MNVNYPQLFDEVRCKCGELNPVPKIAIASNCARCGEKIR